MNSDTGRYVVKCRRVEEECKWYVRASKIKNSDVFSIKTYIQMHIYSQPSSSLGTRRKNTPRLVAFILQDDRKT